MVLLLTASRGAGAQNTSIRATRPLPGANVTGPGGTLAPLTALGSDGPWILIYALPDSPSTSRLLEALSSWSLSGQLTRIVVVVRGVPDSSRISETWQARLPGVQWAADPQGTAGHALQLSAAPTVFGVRQQQIAWTLGGVLNDPTALRGVVEGWLRP